MTNLRAGISKPVLGLEATSNTQRSPRQDSWPEWRGRLVLIALLAIAGFYLVTEQTAHVLGALPYVLLGVFLLLHPFFHAGHGGHDEPGETTHPVRDADHEEHHSRHTKGEKP